MRPTTARLLARHGCRPRRLALLVVAVTTGLATGLGGAVVLETGASAATSYGTLAAPSGTLPGANLCGTYTYRYTVTPPAGKWLLHTTVTDPRGNAVSSYDALGGYSAGGTDATTSFQLCRNNTLPGTFTITGQLSVDDDKGTATSVKDYAVTAGSFTLTDAPAAVTTTKKHKNKKHKKKNKRKKHKNRR